MSKELDVLMEDTQIGTVTQDARGRFRFAYDDSYRKSKSAIPLSISMPLSTAEHGDKAVRPYMWGLLPDKDETLNNWGKRFGVKPRNPFAMLGEVGEDRPSGCRARPDPWRRLAVFRDPTGAGDPTHRT